MPATLRPVFEFLAELEHHNERPWFEARRDRYERARETAEAFVFSLFPALGLDRGTRKASFYFNRIYRDARFTKDKTPYSPRFGCVLGPDGKKGPGLGCYLHLKPGDVFLAGGLWAPEPAQLKRFRLDMEDGPRAFLKLLAAPDFTKHLHLLDGDKLKKVPRGFSEDHPAADLLKLKQIVAWRTFSDDQAYAEDFGAELVATYHAVQPFLAYLEEACGTS